MPKTLKLLLTENVDSLGIVGDVVNVRLGFARNYLLPREMATTPTEEAIAGVAQKRAEAQRQLAELRKQREELIHRMDGVHITIVRSCNDLGHLYASVTQQEIAGALAAAGYTGVKPRDVRLNQNIKRVDTYDVHIKFESDLDSTIKLTVQPDRKLDLDRAAQAEAEAQAAAEAAKAGGGEGAGEAGAGAEGGGGAVATEAAPAEKKPKEKKGKGGGEKPADGEAAAPAPEKKKEKKPKGEKKDGGEAGGGAPAEEKKKSTGWGTPVTRPEGLDFLGQGRRRGKRERE
jgi:large subunit ribosomal protein L9